MTDLCERARRYFVAHHRLSLATDGPGGLWAATVLYVPIHDGFSFWFISDPRSRHGRNLRASGWLAGTVTDGNAPEAATAKGIQLEGGVESVEAPTEKAKAILAVVSRFPCMKKRLEERAEPYTVYRARPTHLCFVDLEEGEIAGELSGEALARAAQG